MTIRRLRAVQEKEREEQHKSIWNTVFILINARGVNVNSSWDYMGMEFWSSFLYSHLVYMIAGLKKKKTWIYAHLYITIWYLAHYMCSRAHVNNVNSKLKSASVIHFSLMILMAKHPIFCKYLILSFHRLLKVGLFVLLQCVNACDLKVFVSIVLWIRSPAHSYW